MFTGITRGTYPIVSLRREPALLRYAVDLGTYGAGLEIGASVSIDGVCQTVVALEGTAAQFDAIAETLDKTTLGARQLGDLVSVERSARMGDELGGHLVSGHVVGRGTIRDLRAGSNVLDLSIGVPSEWMRFVLEKGFIAIDGSSLTVGRVEDNAFWVHLIPETVRLTNFGRRRAGDEVNVELDPQTVAIVTTVERVLAARPPR